MKKYILAIDQGTTSTRAIIFDRNSNIIAQSQKEINQIYPEYGWVEHDPKEILLSVSEVINDLIVKNNIDPEEIETMGLTNQRETTIIWDRLTGEPIYNAIVWQSRQTEEICNDLIEKGYEAVIKAKTGLSLDPYFSATKIRFILNKVKNGQKRAENGELCFGTVDSWLIYKMTDNHFTDITNASRTLLCNIETGTWDDELLGIFNIPKIMLPEIKECSADFGQIKDFYFFGKKINIMGVAGDQHAALYGQQCLKKGDLKTTYGTGCFMLLNTGSKIVSTNNGLISTIAWKINNETTYALEGSIFVGGSAIQWLRDGLKIIDNASESEELAKKVDDNGGVYFVPAFVGLGAPYWESEARGTIFGITRGTTNEHIARATIEAVAFQVNDVFKEMEKVTGKKIQKMKVDGGATRNKLLMQFQADLINQPIQIPKILETTALGAAYFAGLKAGFWKSKLDIEKQFCLSEEMTPSILQVERSNLLKKWHAAVESTIIFSNLANQD